MLEKPLLLDRVGWLILSTQGHGCCFLLLFDRTRQGMVVKSTRSYFSFLFLGSRPPPPRLTGSHQSAS